MIYESTFDTDWTSLTIDEAVHRAFALGVAATLGQERPEEYERLVREQSRALVQMAYDEGRTRASDLEAELSGPGDQAVPDESSMEEAIWDRLVVGEAQSNRLRSRARRCSRDDPPVALEMPSMLGLPDDSPTMQELPEFLER
ncbi:MAG: hypothetical protein ABEJ76_08430 [Halanaeroarchaeum sp.]